MKSFTKFYVLLFALLITFGMTAQQTDSRNSVEAEKYMQTKQLKDAQSPGEYDPADFPPPSRQGGEDIGSALVIGGLPYSDAGTTAGYTNDYDEACPYTGSTSPDVVYSFTPTEDLSVQIDLCNSGYDTKLYVYENAETSGSPYACNDDGCPGFRSILNNVLMTVGNTYYIVIDGYGGGSGAYDLQMNGSTPPEPAEPITMFPFFEDFENCEYPAEIEPKFGAQMLNNVIPAAGYESDCGARLGGTSYNWFYYSSNCDLSIKNNIPASEGGTAFGSYGEHWSKMYMDVRPDGSPGAMQLDFDINRYANYSFGYYNGFQVWINGVKVTEKETGMDCFRGEVDGSGWSKMIFDLAPFQNDAQFDIEIICIGAYANDKVYIDNVQIWYVPAGDLEGYAYNMGVATENVEIGFLADPPPFPYEMTNASGYYRFTNVPTEPINPWPMYAFLDGVNYVEADVMLTTGVMTQFDWNVSSPQMVITPAVLEETMNPNEWRSVPITITNGPTGGPLHWTAEIVFGPPPPPVMTVFNPSPEVAETVAPDGRVFLTDGEEPQWEAITADLRNANDTRDGLDIAIVTSALPASNNFSAISSALIALGINSIDVIALQPLTTTADDLLEYDGVIFGLNTFFTTGTAPVGNMLADYIDEGGKLIITSPINATGYTNLPIAGRLLDEGYDPCGTGGLNGASVSLGTYDDSHPIMEGVTSSGGSLTINCQPNTDAELVASWNTNTCYVATKTVTNPVVHVNVFIAATGYVSGQVDLVIFNALNWLQSSGGGGWLDLTAFEGDVPPGESDFVRALFDATGTVPGQVWTADINFTAQPNVSTSSVDVTMIIAGEPLISVDDLEVEIVDMATGQVDMSWTYTGNDITFEYFLIRRDNAPIANTTNTSYTDMLPEYGEYCYTVSAVFTEGESAPAGPECVIWLIPELCYTPDPLYGEVWIGYEESFPLTLENCGDGTLLFEFTDFDDPDFSNGFVTAVDPYTGSIPEGETMVVNVTFDATGYSTGTYSVDLDMVTNEIAPDNERLIACDMFAYQPATLYGVVTDCDNGLPLSNVTVMASGANSFFGETDATGYYEFSVDEDTYDITFSKLSFNSYVELGVFAPQGVMTEVNASLCETPYPVFSVLLDPNEADTEALITWTLPMGPYEIIYDDGTAENYFAWIQVGGAVAVKFTPAGYPATVEGGRLFVGDGSYPEGAIFLNQPMAVGIFDDDGVNGMPGTVLDSSVITVDNYGWVDFGLNGSTFEDGNFYVGMWQLNTPPFSPPVGIDEQNPVVFRSYTKQAGMDWQMSSYNDFMIRAIVFGPGDNVNATTMMGESVSPPKPTDMAHIAMKRPTGVSGTVKGGEFMPVVVEQGSDRDLERYRVAFAHGFDPDAGEMPWDGALTMITHTQQNQYTDNAWGSQDPGFYAYAIQARYESSDADWAYSNVAAHLLDREVTVNVIQCDGEEPSGAYITLMGHNYPYQMLSMVTPASGTVVFDSVIMGVYDLTAVKLGYQAWSWPNMVVSGDMEVNVTFQETEYPARNLYVDPLSSIATWDEPLYLQVPMQGFEDEVFPPAGWQNWSNSDGWERSNGYSSGFWTIPPLPDEGGEWFALAEDDSDLGDDCCTYLITPMLNLLEAPDYAFEFLYYWDAAWGAAGGYVHYSTDGGATWVEMELLPTVFEWTQYSIDISALSGAGGEEEIWFAFQYDDGNTWASGFAVDNVYVGNGPVDVVGYHVYLDDGFVAETDADTRTYQYGDLQYGTVYTASVAALYNCNVSDPIYYTFTSGYLYPPRNLYNEYLYNTNEVPLFWNPPVTGDGVPMMVTLNETIEAEPALAADDRTFLTDGETPNWDAITADLRNANDTRDGLDIAIVTSALPASNDFSALSAALMTLGINSIEVIALQPLTITAEELHDTYQGVIFGLNTFFTVGTEPVGDMLADYVDMGGKLILTSPINATGYTNLPIAGRLNTDGYFPCTTGGLNGATVSLGTFDADHPIMEDVTTAGGSLTISCNTAADAEEVALWNTGTTFVATKTVTNPVVHINTFVAASGYISGDVPLVFFNALNWLQSGVSIGVPEGLMSFNIYQNGMFVGNKLYEGQGYEELVSWVHNPVDPDCHEYTVTAVYDLAAYGFPGQTGESYHEGPDTACVVWGIDLPFMEDWTSGNLDFNSWSTTESNWMVSNANGNPAPSAQFNWDPDPGSGYSIPLTSAPLKADLLTEGDIWMDFEYYLNSRNDTMFTEKLAVEVYNGQEWMQVAEYVSGPSVDWTFQHLQITNVAMSRVFQVRFNAMGDNSFNIVNWNVDNIHIYRACGAPSELDGAYVWNTGEDYGAEITWMAPELPLPPEGWIRWDDGVSVSGIGLVDFGDLSVAARWDAGQLTNLEGVDYTGTSITKIQLFANDTAFSHINVKIWTGPSASTLIYEGADTMPAFGVWSEYAIDPPILLDVDQELWIGYTIVGQVAGTFPAGVDDGPAEAGYGDMISTDGVNWDNLFELGEDRNWSVAAYVETLEGTVASIPTALIDDTQYNNTSNELGIGDIREGVAFEDTESRDFTGFNVYRMGPGEMEYTFVATVPWEEDVTMYSYYDADPYPTAGYPYDVCYQVTAVWESETDFCESEPALNVLPIMDYACLTVTSIDDPLAGDMTSLYPNPASDQVSITSSQQMERIKIVNYVGQMVYESEMSGEQHVVLNTGSYEAGVYIVKINTANGVVTKRMIISR